MSYELATSLDDLESFLKTEHPDQVFGLDTEASSLNTRTAKIAGFSVSLQPGTGIYVPTGHFTGTNLNIHEAYALLDDKMRKGYRPVFYNAKYDLNILQVATKKKITRFHDGLELVYLSDPDRKRKGLKLVAKEDLNFEMTKFEDIFTPAEIKAKKYDIRTKTPLRCRDYAAADADATLRVWEKYKGVEDDYKMAVTIDYAVTDIVRRIEHNGGLELNAEYINQQLDHLESLATAMQEQIYRAVGYEFEINSPKQLGIALFEKLGIPSQGMTTAKNPMHVTKEEVLEKLSSTYPVVDWVIAYRKLQKAQSSYFLKLKKLSDRGIKPRFNFNMFAAPTFRFAAPGGDPDVDGATGVNIQAVSNGEARDLLAANITQGLSGTQEDYIAAVEEDDMLITQLAEDYDDKIDLTTDFQSLLRQKSYILPTDRGEQVCVRDSCTGCFVGCSARGIDVTRRTEKNIQLIPSVRQSFKAPDGFKLVSFDYDRQELVIGANMSKEPKWINALLAGTDLHAVTAAATYGLRLDQFLASEFTNPVEFKKKRAIGKMLNFAIFYGATAYTLAMKAGISKAQAELIYDGFVANHPVLMNWIKKVHIFSQKNGYTTTYFGRKRYLDHLYNTGDRKMIAFANRSACNTAIQGTAAEVTRIAMAKTMKRLETDGYSWGDVKMVLQIHDELAFLIRDELVDEVCPKIKGSMEFKVPSWDVQLAVGAKIGSVWGNQKDMIGLVAA